MYVSVCTHISKIYGQVVLTKINAICFYSFFSVCKMELSINGIVHKVFWCLSINDIVRNAERKHPLSVTVHIFLCLYGNKHGKMGYLLVYFTWEQIHLTSEVWNCPDDLSITFHWWNLIPWASFCWFNALALHFWAVFLVVIRRQYISIQKGK